MKGGGLSADSASNIYGETGEGNFTPGTNFGSSVFRVTQSGNSLQVADWFTPWNQDFLSKNDLDLNDAVLVLPDQPGSHPHLALAVGKEGTVYVLDRDNMGKYCASCTAGDTQIVQELPQVGEGNGLSRLLEMAWCTPLAPDIQSWDGRSTMACCRARRWCKRRRRWADILPSLLLPARRTGSCGRSMAQI